MGKQTLGHVIVGVLTIAGGPKLLGMETQIASKVKGCYYHNSSKFSLPGGRLHFSP
jgi:hypothetical protein